MKHSDMSFSQLKGSLGIGKSNLSNHLKELVKGPLVSNYYKKELLNDNYSYYELTAFGERFMLRLFDSLSLEMASAKQLQTSQDEVVDMHSGRRQYFISTPAEVPQKLRSKAYAKYANVRRSNMTGGAHG
jgi:DNA-binding HxlR family transcriptional regulator